TVETLSLLRLLSKADVKSREVAHATGLGIRTYDVAAGAPYMEMDPKDVRFSYTSISNYAKCPYMAMLSLELTNKVPEDFEPSKQNDRAIGTTLHCAIQAFMEKHFNEYLDEHNLEQYKQEISSCLEAELERSPFDDYTKQSIRGKYLKSLFGVVSILLAEKGKTGFIGTMVPIRNELELDADPAFKGFIDTVVRSNEGDTYLIDYKKGGAEGTYQLILYKRLYEKAFPKDDVKECFFYSMKDACFKSVGKKAEQLEADLDRDIEDARYGYREGSWIAKPDKQSCQNCSERRICRRRFNLQ
ncbi:MAG: PD-(D/E)XK nuclease family protein, partial [Sphaerochaetaceae bacterium]|nr:PD-(D/E)XK nuclease family protein [Sphaerochaetaceae bacterium]